MTELAPAQAGVVLEALQQAVARVLELDPASVLATARYVEDLGADSLARVEIAEVFEQDLAARGVVAVGGAPFRIPDEDLDGLRSVQETVDHALVVLARG